MLSTEVSDSGQPVLLTRESKHPKTRRKLNFSDSGSESSTKFVNRLVYVDDSRLLESPYDQYMSKPSIHGREHLYMAKLCDNID